VTSEAAPRRPFGLWSATALVVANMIGAGVFTTSGFALGDLGSRGQVMAAWVLGGFIALCGALSYGALVRRMAESGGEYLFLSRFVHPLVGFLAGWVSLLAGFTGAIAFAATAFEAYALPGPARPGWLPEGAMAVGVILVCGLLHGRIVHRGLLMQNLVVALKLVLLVGFVGYALAWLARGGWPGSSLPDPGATFSVTAFASSLVWISLSYSGFNAAVYVAGEVRDASRTVPRALWLGTLVVAGFYLLLNAVFLYAPAPDALAGRPDVAAVAAAALGGQWPAGLIRLAISLALLSSVSSMIIAGPRVYARMAGDGVFPQLFRSSGSVGGKAPTASIILQAVLAILVVMASTLSQLLSYLGFTLSLSAAGTVVCIFLVRRREGALALPCTGYPLIPGIFVVATLVLAGLAATHRPWELVAALATIASGVVAYSIFRKR
jgi:amino acid transporter